ncbi:MAG: metallophosphoesterase family protein [Myxococcales bacterium]|nr:metallophosphoesterase family protein [Myxococcales bacterium]
MPRIVVISDIHGNLDALQAVWGDVRRRKADKILFLGDAVAFGPEPNETIEFLSDVVKPDLVLRGNTDRYLLESLWKKKEHNLQPAVAQSLEWTAGKLSKKSNEYLSKMADETRLEIDGLKLLLCHASPGSDEIGVKAGDNEHLSAAFESAKVDVVLCGHTHVPYRTRIAGTEAINVGSVGFPFDRDLRACYLSFFVGDGEIQELTFCKVSYPTDRTVAKMNETEMGGKSLFVHRLLTGTASEPKLAPEKQG